MKKQFTPVQKANVALSMLKGEKTVSQISSLFQVHPTQIKQWEKIAKEGLASLFTDKRKREEKEKEELIEELYKIIGQRDTELDWLKKNCTLTPSERVALAEWNHPTISLLRQADLLEISRSSLYYVPKPNSEDKLIMDCIDTIYTDYPFYGSRRIKIELFDRYAVSICRQHVQRLMRVLGIEAIYPRGKRKTSIGNESHKKYPYLLSGIKVIRPDQVWGTDITYIRLENGWCYLVVIMDWFSRYVIAWRLSETLESDFCIETLKDALLDGVPDIHNSDQGVQYTSTEYTSLLEDYEIRISMDARGRCFDNIFTERLWRTVKYENVYLQSYRTIEDAKIGLTEYFNFYNRKRKHQALGYKTPEQAYTTD